MGTRRVDPSNRSLLTPRFARFASNSCSSKFWIIPNHLLSARWSRLSRSNFRGEVWRKGTHDAPAGIIPILEDRAWNIANKEPTLEVLRCRASLWGAFIRYTTHILAREKLEAPRLSSRTALEVSAIQPIIAHCPDQAATSQQQE